MDWKVYVLECSVTVRVVRNGARGLGLTAQQTQVFLLTLTPSRVK